MTISCCVVSQILSRRLTVANNLDVLIIKSPSPPHCLCLARCGPVRLAIAAGSLRAGLTGPAGALLPADTALFPAARWESEVG